MGLLGSVGLASAGAEAVSVEALGWQPVKEKTVRAALNAVKVGRSLFTATDLTAGRVTGKAGKYSPQLGQACDKRLGHVLDVERMLGGLATGGGAFVQALTVEQ